MTAIAHDDPPRGQRTTEPTMSEPAPQPDPKPVKENFPEDAALRAAGFEIVSRPAHGQAIWTKSGIEFLQSEALWRLNGPPKEG